MALANTQISSRAPDAAGSGRRDRPRRGRGRVDVRVHRRAARTAGARARTRRAHRQENPHLRRRPLQFHQPPRRAGELPLRAAGFLPFRPGALPAGGFHRARRTPRHRLPRKKARPAFLRRVVRARSSRCSPPSARDAGVRIETGARRARGRRGGRIGVFQIRLDGGRMLRARSLVVACGRLVLAEARRQRPRVPAGAAVRAANRRRRGRGWCR